MHRATHWFLALAAALGTGCVALGPTPGMTFNSAVPASRPGAELTTSFVPGYMLSGGVREPTQPSPQWGSPMLQIALLVDPATLLGNSGFSAGFRVINATDGYLEPELRYRRSFFDHDLLSVGTTLSGTAVKYEDTVHPGLGYRAGRGTLEAGAEFRVTPPWWVELRAIGGGSATALAADGTWCANAIDGAPRVCPESTENTVVQTVTGSALGVYWSGYGGLAVDALRPQNSFFHFARVAGVVAAGSMPTMLPVPAKPGITQNETVRADQGPDHLWAYWGLSVTLAFGAPGEAPRPAQPAPTPPPAPAATMAPSAPAPPLPEPDPANVRGQVRGAGGAPVPSAAVQVVEAHVTERTDERGEFRLHVPAGRYTLRFEAEGLVSQTKTVTVTPGEQALFFVNLAPSTP